MPSAMDGTRTAGTIMPDVVLLMPAAAGGAAIGLLYFGGLWVTVRRLPHTRRPVILTIGSFVLRAVIAAAGFALLLADEPLRLVVALSGFLAVRFVIVHRVRPEAATGGGGDR